LWKALEERMKGLETLLSKNRNDNATLDLFPGVLSEEMLI